MASSNYGSLSPHQIEAWITSVMPAAAQTQNRWPFPVGPKIVRNQPYPPGWKLGSIKRKGRPTIFLLWIDNVQMGPFNTMTARKRFIKTTLELQNAEP